MVRIQRVQIMDRWSLKRAISNLPGSTEVVDAIALSRRESRSESNKGDRHIHPLRILLARRKQHDGTACSHWRGSHGILRFGALEKSSS